MKTRPRSSRKFSNLMMTSLRFSCYLRFSEDGTVDIKRRSITLAIGNSKYELWRDIVRRMKALSFGVNNGGHKKNIRICSSKAVELVKKWLSDTLIRAMIEDLGQLFDADKLRNLITLTNARVRPKGKSIIEIVDGVWMGVRICDGYVELSIVRRRLEDVKAVQERLRSAGYNTEPSQRGKRFVIYIGQDEIEKCPELVAKVCEVLRRVHEEAMNEKH